MAIILYKYKICSLIIFGLVFMQCTKDITTSIAVKHDQQVLITGSSNPGVPYHSKGFIVVQKSSSEMGFFDFEFVSYFGNAFAGLAGTGDASASAEMEAFLREELVKKVKEVGANGVINVKYSYSKISVCLPIIGPGTGIVYQAQGEAVLLK